MVWRAVVGLGGGATTTTYIYTIHYTCTGIDTVITHQVYGMTLHKVIFTNHSRVPTVRAHIEEHTTKPQAPALHWTVDSTHPGRQAGLRLTWMCLSREGFILLALLLVQPRHWQATGKEEMGVTCS